MRAAWLAACLLAVATAPAAALSCLRSDIVTIYQQARDATEGFWIVRGRITADGPVAVPEPDGTGRYSDDASASTGVRFSGEGMRGDGTFAPFERDVTLTILCFAHWCGGAPLDTEIFAAIEVKDTGPELVVDPCGSRVAGFTEDGADRLRACVRDGVCRTE